MLDKVPGLDRLEKLELPELSATNAAIATAGVVFLLLVRGFTKKSKYPLPPGPPGKPIVGNFLDLLPLKEGWILPQLFRDVGRSSNSELVYANLCGVHVVVVNTAEAANEIFQQRANIYTQRPNLNALRKILAIDWLAAIMPNDQHWNDLRKGFATYFKTEQYRPVETRSAHTLLRSLLSTPADFLAHFRHMHTATTIAVTYGIDMPPGTNDEYVGIGQRVLEGIWYGTSLFALAFDAIPALRFIPSCLLPYKWNARPRRGHAKDMVEVPWAQLQKAIADGTAKPSIVYNMLNDAKTKEDEELAKQEGANVYFSGVNNMNSALAGFVMAMAKYPEVQKRAQQEIDSVLGSERLPEFVDLPALPFIDALVKETLRWHPVTPLAIPHAATQDDVYKGYLIPKGSVVIGNVWAMLHEDSVFPDPEAFKPERWLSKPAGEFPFAAFGFGRRLCPGLAFTRDHLWISIASILAAYDISYAVDADGKPIEPKEDWSPTLFSFPEAFQVKFTPRSQAAKDLVVATATEEPLSDG